MNNGIRTIQLVNGNKYSVGSDSRGEQIDARMVRSDVTRNSAFIVAKSPEMALELEREAKAWGASSTQRTGAVLVIRGE